MAINAQSELIDYLRTAYYVWFTTVRDDGMPQPTPVWFLWLEADQKILIFSQPSAQKVKNIRSNPKVAVSYAFNDANDYVVVMGEAAITDSVPSDQLDMYLTKYDQGILALGMTRDSMIAAFSAVIIVTPQRIRGE
jgi:PPOX class probable F420-dependent enzyme